METAFNYRLGEVQRVEKVGRDQVGRLMKVKTASGDVWLAGDLTPRAPYTDPLDEEALGFCVELLEMAARASPEDAQDCLDLMGKLTQGQKQQVWAVLPRDVKQQLGRVKRGEVA